MPDDMNVFVGPFPELCTECGGTNGDGYESEITHFASCSKAPTGKRAKMEPVRVRPEDLPPELREMLRPSEGAAQTAKPVACEKCGGQGFVGGNPYPCSACAGWGTLRSTTDDHAAPCSCAALREKYAEIAVADARLSRAVDSQRQEIARLNTEISHMREAMEHNEAHTERIHGELADRDARIAALTRDAERWQYVRQFLCSAGTIAQAGQVTHHVRFCIIPAKITVPLGQEIDLVSVIDSALSAPAAPSQAPEVGR